MESDLDPGASGMRRAPAPAEASARQARTAYMQGCAEDGRHAAVSHRVLAARLARILGFDFGGAVEAAGANAGCYLIPTKTLIGADSWSGWVKGELDLFGGFAPHPFMATKTVMHPLVSPDAAAPAGWPHGLSREIGDAALPGYSAFAAADAVSAGLLLLENGAPVRLKPAMGEGGRGQVTVADRGELEAAVAALEDGIFEGGLVVEGNLGRVETYSVGQARLPGSTISYWGTQRLTRDNEGGSAYGGSQLFVVRGGYDELLARTPEKDIRDMIGLACRFDELAGRHLPELVASRRNYDVARGIAADGSVRVGVLEQSWRIGGASGAEILALEAFTDDPSLAAVRAATTEIYGSGACAPADAMVIYRGEDAVVGPLLKFAQVEERFAGPQS